MQSPIESALRELRASRSEGDGVAEAAALHRVGEAYAANGQLSEAINWFRQTAAAYAALDLSAGAAGALANIGALLSRQSKWLEAVAVLRQVLDLAIERGDQASEADISFNLCFVLLRLGKHDEARAFGLRSAEIYRKRQDTLHLGLALGNIGKVERAAGNLEAAVAMQSKSIDLLEQAGADRDRVEAMFNLGTACRELGAIDRARQTIETAMTLLGNEVDPRTRAGALLNLGTVQDGEVALGTYRTARELFHRGEDPYGEGIALLNAGQIEMAAADEETRRAGRQHVEFARDLLVEIGAPEAEVALTILAGLD